VLPIAVLEVPCRLLSAIPPATRTNVLVSVYTETVADIGQIDLWQARTLLTTLRQDLQKIVDRDPEQEVRGIAIPVLDAALSAVRDLASSNPVVASVRDVISAEAIEEGEPVRAVDVLMVVTTLLAVTPHPPQSLPRAAKRRDPWPPRF
jgi:hypothetical protein